MDFKPGALVRVRDRDWVVLPSTDENLVLLKPMGGSEEEITGIYLPLGFPDDHIQSTRFPYPSPDHLGDFSSARLLYNATRLAFRNGAGPFRSLAKLSFRPRAYQMVPLIMALRQEGPVRLLVADDVGVGKTIEALLILKELLERGIIKRFAVVVLPHLCEQWRQELEDKVGIDAVIIRSNTQARLDREIQGDTSVYDYYPYQVISIDYIKSEQRRQVFIQECPEMVIVDEAHTCSKPSSSNKVQQQRHRLIMDISKKSGQHLILLTATPHSGKQEQFNSLLALIHEKYSTLDLPHSTREQRKELAQYYVQRRRKNVVRWMGEDTPFPDRDAGEFPYDFSEKYEDFYDKMIEFAFGLTKIDEAHAGRRKMRYWTALALLRGVMSSPAAGVKMLENREERVDDSQPEETELGEFESNPLIDDDFGVRDYLDTHITRLTDWEKNERERLRELSNELKGLQGIVYDRKVAHTLEIIKKWVKEGYNPVIFCRFIETAKYVGEVLGPELENIFKNIDARVVTSEDPDDVRKQRIEDMTRSKKKVLVATDCLSEGINLQDQFTAVLHYDLPWNPNRLEQREGRIDRFGQKAPGVKAYLLYGKNNPIDGVVLKVLLRKVREIRKSIGISIPFPEDSKSLMDAVLQEVISNPSHSRNARQLSFDFGDFDQVKQKELVATKAIEKAADREKVSRDIFTQNAIKDREIEEDLKKADEAIGDPKSVEAFVTEALPDLLGVQVSADREGFVIYTTNLPGVLKSALPQGNQLKVSFKSPTPEGYYYLGRNHAFVEQLCRYLMANAVSGNTRFGPARAAVIRCRDVEVKTTLLLFRVRNVIEGKRDRNKLVAEEMLVWGYSGYAGDKKVLTHEQVTYLLNNAVSSSSITDEAAAGYLNHESDDLKLLKDEFDSIALKRAEILIEAHERFRKVVGGKQFKVVKPVLPMDIMGIYLLLPEKK